MDNVDNNMSRIAEALERLAEQSEPWERTRISVLGAFVDRLGRRICMIEEGSNTFVYCGSSVVFAGTWTQCLRHTDRLFREDITARALAATSKAPAESAIEWQRVLFGAIGVTRNAEPDKIRRYGWRGAGVGYVAYVQDGERQYDIAECASADAAKALCEAWDRAFLEVTKEVLS